MMLPKKLKFMKLKNGGNVFELGQYLGPVTVSSWWIIIEKINKGQKVFEAREETTGV